MELQRRGEACSSGCTPRSTCAPVAQSLSRGRRAPRLLSPAEADGEAAGIACTGT